MVITEGNLTVTLGDFQYSLCRVVLMVFLPERSVDGNWILSVLALSSRFDGHVGELGELFNNVTFSTRSVESF